jgi:hypothetical protein
MREQLAYMLQRATTDDIREAFRAITKPKLRSVIVDLTRLLSGDKSEPKKPAEPAPPLPQEAALAELEPDIPPSLDRRVKQLH